ncbi:MAG: hypothetical protein IV100_14580 [Myxococcales bacterium]|nr:hypothetical protein [Myxococcales bacterium]
MISRYVVTPPSRALFSPRATTAWLLASGLLLVACADESSLSTATDDATMEADVMDASDIAVAEDTVDDDDASPDGGDTTTDDTSADTEDPADTADVSAPPYPLAVKPPVAPKADPLAGKDVTSCALFAEERCESGMLQRCQVYDVASETFPESLDPLFERVLHYERWYELYQAPDGQTADRVFTGATPAGTPEAEWGAPEHFGGWDGAGDSAIWSGTALTAFALRYAETGTEADRARLHLKTRQILTQFDVTGIPGYLARYHFLRVPDGTPQTDDHILRYASEDYGYKDHTFDPAWAPDLPAVYHTGLPGPSGTTIPVEPMWRGNPSIDQYSGPVVGLTLAWSLLDDAALKARITTHVTCYLKRLQRIEVKNLQGNPEALAAFQALAGGGRLGNEPDDFDFTTLDTLVAYGLLQPNTKNAESYDRTCPATISPAPPRVLDAAAPDFLVQLLALANDIGSGNAESPTGIDHAYISVRGGDAMHLIHMGAMGYLMTGEVQYKDFVEQIVIEQHHAVEIAQTTGSFRLPPWCTSYYGHHITFTPAWGLITMLEAGPLRHAMETAFHTELWQKLLRDHDNAKFDLQYATALAPDVATDAQEALTRALAQLNRLGGNGGVLDDPRRMYHRPYETIEAALPEGITRRCPTEAERKQCEDGFNVFSIPIPGEAITKPCTGKPNECVMEDGLCAEAIASSGLPADLRPWEDFLWQRSPFEMGQNVSVEGYKQSPGLDLIEPFWLARQTGKLAAGKGQVLAWKSTGQSCGE